MEQITSTQVPDNQRPSFIVGKIGNLFIPFEQEVYRTAGAYSQYEGGYWEFHQLSNGGFYMAPDNDTLYHFENTENYSDVDLSSEALGIVACLYAFSRMSFTYASLGDFYHKLRDFAQAHPEAGAIFEAID